MKHNKFVQSIMHQRGFTLAELSFALLFVGFIITFLMTTLLSIIQIYNKGISLSQITAAGRQIDSDMTNAVRYGGTIAGDNNIQRLCTKGVSYIWNKQGSFKNRFSDESSSDLSKSKLRLVRVKDPNAEFCNVASKMPDRKSTTQPVTILVGPSVDILAFDVTKNDTIGLMRVKSVLSTTGDNRPTKQSDGHWSCLDQNGDNQYCAFAEFDTTVYRRKI
jgi:type II secretory pathway pseudopilin PulG